MTTKLIFIATFVVCALHLASAVAPPAIKYIVGRQSSCETDCKLFCPDAAKAPYEHCVSTSSRSCGLLRRRCGCDCVRRTELGMCMEIVKSGNYAGTFGVTNRQAKSHPIYSDGAREIEWTGSGWNLKDTSTGSVFSSCPYADIGRCPTFKCKTLYRSDGRCGGSYNSTDYPSQIAICNSNSDKPCCGNDNRCGGSKESCLCEGAKGTNTKCMDYGGVTGSCIYEQVLNAGSPNNCDIKSLDKLDDELRIQQVWNVAKLISNVAPGPLGGALDLLFALIDPVSPVTNQFGVANYIIEGFNKKIGSVRNCLDQQILQTEEKILTGDLYPLILEVRGCQQMHMQDASDGDRSQCVSNLFSRFWPQLQTSFRLDAGTSSLSYENLLPAYQALVPVFYTLATEHLEHNARAKDCHDMCNAKKDTRDTMNTLKTWATAAMNAIEKFETPPVTDFNRLKCNRGRGSNKITLGDEKYFVANILEGTKTQYCQHTRMRQTINVEMAMTKRNEKKCTFSLAGTWVCDNKLESICAALKSQANIFAQSSKNRFESEFRTQFTRRYLETIDDYLESLEKVQLPKCKKSNQKNPIFVKSGSGYVCNN